MQNPDKTHIYELFDQMLDLCEERGLTGEELIIVGAMTDDKKTIEYYGEEEALHLAIEAIKPCRNSDEVFFVIEKLFAFDDM